LKDRVELRGWVTGEAKMESFEGCSILVLPSYSEGLPNVLLEAMAAGLAVIATTVGGIPELITHGVNGILIEPRNSIALAKALKELINQPELVRRMGEVNREKVRAFHDIGHLWKDVGRALGVIQE
jgi:glycosyltransferase involved in cell wall biosynthesis